MKTRLLPACAAALVVFLAGPGRAAAEYVTLQYQGSANNPTVSNSLQSNAPTGPFYWTENNLPPSGLVPNPATTFCIELTAGQNLPNTVGTNVVFDVQPLANDTNIGSAKASAITELYGRYYDTAWQTPATGQSADAVAFQLALWELVYDGKPAAGNTTDLSNGTLTVPAIDSPGYTPRATAQTMLNSLNGDGSSFTNRFGGQELVALIAPAPGAKQVDQVQDQITMPPKGEVPAPAGVVLAGLGFLGLLGRARLTRRKTTA